MGTKIFDFLTESFLFDDSLVQDYFHGTSDQDIFAELTRYREFCLSASNEIEQEILAHDSNLKVFAGTELVPPIVLMQSAFYVEQYILYDPLFPLTQNRSEAAAVMNQYMGFSNGPFDRMALVQAIRYLKHLTPMAAAGYVKFIPASYVFEPPKEIPFSYSSNQFADVLPQPLLKFFHDNAVVEAMKRVDQKYVTEGTLYPTRAIHIGFKEHYGPEASSQSRCH